VFSDRGSKTRSAPRGGFSLLEVTISAAIITVGMLALLSLFPVSSNNLVASAGTTEAVNLGAQQIEKMRNVQFPPAGGADTQTFLGVAYTRTWNVIVAGTAPNRTATITVTITWPGRGGTLPFTTILAE